jgi:prolyl 4-hydroxylase
MHRKRCYVQKLTFYSNAHYTPSTIFTGTDETFDPSIRNSSKALLPRDNTVQCIEARAREFQGWKPDVYIERLWSQRYQPGGHYVHHFDWSGDIVRNGAGRVSTFMVYLDDECTGGGTEFPRLKRPSGEGWCNFIHCYDDDNHSDHDEEVVGVVFKPTKGNAVYWENFRSDGRGYEETWHAGLPVKSGVKVGLNIWSWYQPGYADTPKS